MYIPSKIIPKGEYVEYDIIHKHFDLEFNNQDKGIVWAEWTTQSGDKNYSVLRKDSSVFVAEGFHKIKFQNHGENTINISLAFGQGEVKKLNDEIQITGAVGISNEIKDGSKVPMLVEFEGGGEMPVVNKPGSTLDVQIAGQDGGELEVEVVSMPTGYSQKVVNDPDEDLVVVIKNQLDGKTKVINPDGENLNVHVVNMGETKQQTLEYKTLNSFSFYNEGLVIDGNANRKKLIINVASIDDGSTVYFGTDLANDGFSIFGDMCSSSGVFIEEIQGDFRIYVDGSAQIHFAETYYQEVSDASGS